MTYINQISIKDGDSSLVADVKSDGTSNALVVVDNKSKYYSATLTATGAGATQDVTLTPLKSYSLQCTSSGGVATDWDVDLEVSLDGTNWTAPMTHSETSGDGTIIFTGNILYPSRYYRVNVTALTLGTATGLTVCVLGVA